MKIIVASDTHGNNKELISNLKKIENLDFFIHLGDYVEDAVSISKAIGVKAIVVMGNGDHASSGFKEEELIEIKGKKIFLTHGHKLGVSFNLNNLYYRTKELNADIVMFGHTHRPLYKEIDDMIIVNPGSASYPRGFSNHKTFVIMEIDKEIDISHVKFG